MFDHEESSAEDFRWRRMSVRDKALIMQQNYAILETGPEEDNQEEKINDNILMLSCHQSLLTPVYLFRPSNWHV